MLGTPSFEDCPSVFMNPKHATSKGRTSRSTGAASSQSVGVAVGQRQLSSVYCSSSLSFPGGFVTTPSPQAVDHLTMTNANAPIAYSLSQSSGPTVAVQSQQRAAPVRSMPYHPHSNATTAETNPRAALRLLVHLLNALRATGGSGEGCVTLNHYVDNVHVNHDDNYVRLTIDVARLFQHSPFANGSSSGTRHVFDSDLSKALDTIRIGQGPTVEITIVPVMSCQRTSDEFVDQFVHDDLGRLRREGPTRLHYFNPLSFVGPVKRKCYRSDIVCGFVVPDMLLESFLVPDHDTLPFEPMYFDKMSCLFQWFNGDATSSRNCFTTSSSLHQQPLQQQQQAGRSRLRESDIISAYASAVHQRPSLTPVGRLPHPQWYQPFSVRLPSHLSTIESHATAPTVVGSSVNTLEHGLRPVSLPLVSDLLDRALVLAVLRLCNDDV